MKQEGDQLDIRPFRSSASDEQLTDPSSASDQSIRTNKRGSSRWVTAAKRTVIAAAFLAYPGAFIAGGVTDEATGWVRSTREGLQDLSDSAWGAVSDILDSAAKAAKPTRRD